MDTTDIRKLDALPEDLARAAIGNPWSGLEFVRHLSGEHDADWPIAILDRTLMAAIGTRSHTVRLSQDTADKQRDKHGDLEPSDYAWVQRILDRGELFRNPPRSNDLSANLRISGWLLEEDGQLFRTVIKATGDGSEVYMATLHRATLRNLRRARREMERIRRTG